VSAGLPVEADHRALATVLANIGKWAARVDAPKPTASTTGSRRSVCVRGAAPDVPSSFPYPARPCALLTPEPYAHFPLLLRLHVCTRVCTSGRCFTTVCVCPVSARCACCCTDTWCRTRYPRSWDSWGCLCRRWHKQPRLSGVCGLCRLLAPGICGLHDCDFCDDSPCTCRCVDPAFPSPWHTPSLLVIRCPGTSPSHPPMAAFPLSPFPLSPFPLSPPPPPSSSHAPPQLLLGATIQRPSSKMGFPAFGPGSSPAPRSLKEMMGASGQFGGTDPLEGLQYVEVGVGCVRLPFVLFGWSPGAPSGALGWCA
jgi:hypothetical protein